MVNSQLEQTDISKNGLRAIFKMRLRKWHNGSSISVYVLSDDSPLHKKFTKQVLHVFPHQLRRAWNRAVFTGSGQAPIQLKNKQEMINQLSVTPDAIGYLGKEDLNDMLKILEIR